MNVLERSASPMEWNGCLALCNSIFVSHIRLTDESRHPA
ncbi:MAG: hypothetical protein OJF48_000940 [Afipia sp.]|nr:MAG: hypothetical protein OJF48_000940 [Afipia sp.]